MSNIMTRDEELEDITTMSINPFSDITNILQFFCNAYLDENDAENSEIHINCFSKEENGINTQYIEFSDNNGITTTIHPLDKTDGTILQRPITVNGYDLYNAVGSCLTEMLTFWIDEEDNELVLNSFYNPTHDIDELEVRFKIIGDGPKEPPMSGDLITTINLNAISYSTIMKNMNVEKNVNGLYIVVEDGKLTFQTNYNGYIMHFDVKYNNMESYEKDVSIYIPMNIFQLMISTGYVHDLKLDIYNDYISLKTDQYNFMFKYDNSNTHYELPNTDECNRYFVIDTETIEHTVALMNRLNKPAKISVVEFEKVDDGLADITCNVEDRYTISIRTSLAMVSDETISIDSDVLQNMISNANTDAIQLEYISPTKLYMKVENNLFTKTMVYNHEQFMAFREQRLLEYIEKNS